MPYHYGWAAKDGHGLSLKRCQLGSFCMIWKNYCEMRGSHDTQDSAHLVAHQVSILRSLVVFFFLRVSRNILMMFHIGKTIEFTVACEQRVPTFPSNFRVTDAWNQTHVLVTRGKMRGISSEMRCNVTKKKFGRTQHHQLKSGKYMRSNPWAGVLWRLSAMARRGHRPRRHRQ